MPAMPATPATIRAVKAEPGQDPVEVQVGNTLQEMQAVVGGPLEIFNYFTPHDAKHRLNFYCNEEGLPRNLPPNRNRSGDTIRGTILVVAVDVASSTDVDMTDQEVAQAISTCNLWPKLAQPATRPAAPPCKHLRKVENLGGWLCLDCGESIPVPLK